MKNKWKTLAIIAALLAFILPFAFMLGQNIARDSMDKALAEKAARDAEQAQNE